MALERSYAHAPSISCCKMCCLLRVQYTNRRRVGKLLLWEMTRKFTTEFTPFVPILYTIGMKISACQTCFLEFHSKVTKSGLYWYLCMPFLCSSSASFACTRAHSQLGAWICMQWPSVDSTTHIIVRGTALSRQYGFQLHASRRFKGSQITLLSSFSRHNRSR